MATELTVSDPFVCDLVEAWARKFPSSRFTGTTVENARMSVGPQEMNVLVALAIRAELQRLAALAAPDPLDRPPSEWEAGHLTALDEVASQLRARADELTPEES